MIPALTHMPASTEAEMALLAAVLSEPRTYLAAADIVKPEHFSDDRHAKIWTAIGKLDQRGMRPNVILLKGFFEQDGTLESLGGQQYLARLAVSPVSTFNARDYARAIKDAWQRRELISRCHAAIAKAQADDSTLDGDQVVEELASGLYELEEATAREAVSIGEAAQSAIELADQAAKRGTKMVGITTGFADLDRMTGGLEKGNVYDLAARPSMGKTALATGIAWNTARAGNRVAVFSLEMSAEQLGRRLVAPRCGISPSDLKVGAIEDPYQWTRLMEAQQELEKLPIYIDDTPALSMAQIRSRARRLKMRKGLDFIIIDHMGLVAPTKDAMKHGPTHAIGQISRSIKELAKELDVPVMPLVQLSRAVEGREDKRPVLSDLRQSGEIEQDADVVMFVYRDSYYLERARPQKKPGEQNLAYDERLADWNTLCGNAKGLAELIIGKQRDGAIGTIKLAFDEAMAKFSNLHHQGSP